jgi:diguanylate cyclase (GGDEF)-like protein
MTASPKPPSTALPNLPRAHGWSRRMYLLALVPVLTDIIETGGWPRRPREWFTEVTVGLLIALLVRKILSEHETLKALARADGLTGLGNRRAFEEALLQECARAQRLGQPLSLVFMDLDHFKLVNDRAGHAAGDRVLCQLADAVRHVVRMGVDRGFRLGGDEFALLLPGSSPAQAEAVLDRVRRACAGADMLWRDGPLGLSAGVVALGAQESAADFVRRADDAMYLHKRSRRAPPRVPLQPG